MIAPSNLYTLPGSPSLGDLIWKPSDYTHLEFLYCYGLYVVYGMTGIYAYVDHNPDYALELAARMEWAGDIPFDHICNWHDFEKGLPPIIHPRHLP